jgi:hypothetical protein
MATLTKAEMRTLRNLLKKAENVSEPKKSTKPPADPARHERTKALLTWAKKTNHPQIAAKAAYAVSKGGYLKESTFAWAKENGFTK